MRQAICLFLIVSLSLLLNGCGGGGGGSSSAPADSNQLTYTGLTTQAVIDAVNAETLVLGAYFGKERGTVVSPLAGDAANNNSSIPIRNFYRVLRSALRHQASASKEPMAKLAAVDEHTGTYSGSCGGQLVITLRQDYEAESFSGSLGFEGYCQEGITLDGMATIAGNIDLYDGQFYNTSMNFHPLSIDDGAAAYTLDGQVRFNNEAQQYSETVTMDFLLRDDVTGEVFRFENYFLGISDGYDYDEESVSGRYFHPAYGYVDLGTSHPLWFFPYDPWPSNGTLRCSGRHGTFAQMVFLTTTMARLEVDSDGNGHCEWQQETLHALPPDYIPYNHQPLADAGTDLDAFQNDLVTLDGTASFDPDGDLLSFQWGFIACPGTCPPLYNPAAARPSFRPEMDGLYHLRLVVNDGEYSSVATGVQVTVAPVQQAIFTLIGQK